MTFGEINEIMAKLITLNPSELPVEDQIVLMNAQLEYAETIKPIVIKHTAINNTSSNFLFKL